MSVYDAACFTARRVVTSSDKDADWLIVTPLHCPAAKVTWANAYLHYRRTARFDRPLTMDKTARALAKYCQFLDLIDVDWDRVLPDEIHRYIEFLHVPYRLEKVRMRATIDGLVDPVMHAYQFHARNNNGAKTLMEFYVVPGRSGRQGPRRFLHGYVPAAETRARAGRQPANRDAPVRIAPGIIEAVLKSDNWEGESLRNQLFTLTCWATGLRPGMIANLYIDRVEIQPGKIVLRIDQPPPSAEQHWNVASKSIGTKVLLGKLADWWQNLYWAYRDHELPSHPSAGIPLSNYLFVTLKGKNHGGQLSRSAIRGILKAARRVASRELGKNCDSLRWRGLRTAFALELGAAGVDPLVIAAELLHANSSSQDIYKRLTADESAKEISDKLSESPRGSGRDSQRRPAGPKPS